MPLYEYKCSVCGTKFDKLVRFADADSVMACPQCGSDQTKRLVSMFGWSGAGAGGGDSVGSCAPTGGG